MSSEKEILEKLRKTHPEYFKDMQDQVSGKKPFKKYKYKGVQIAVWKNVSQDGKEYSSISISKNYKDANNEWKTTNNLLFSDIFKAIILLEKVLDLEVEEC